MVLWKYDNAIIQIDDLPNGKRYINVSSDDKSTVIPRKNYVTSYPIELIEQILRIKGPNFLIDEIRRDEDRFYLEWRIMKNLFGFVSKSFFDNKTFLDFGCGSGASSIILARMFPKSFIVGIDIDDNSLSIAKLRANYYGFTNCRFILSSESSLPTDFKGFDFIVLSAVYEHLLPNERKTLLSQIWSLLNPNGVLFIIDTPYRYFPVEIHTTGLPLINYFPDRIALAVARRWSKTVKSNESWASLLRRGIRGATSREIMQILINKFPDDPIILKPNKSGLHDEIDLWYEIFQVYFRSILSRKLLSSAKKLLKIIKYLTGITLVHNISIAIRKSRYRP